MYNHKGKPVQWRWDSRILQVVINGCFVTVKMKKKELKRFVRGLDRGRNELLLYKIFRYRGFFVAQIDIEERKTVKRAKKDLQKK